MAEVVLDRVTKVHPDGTVAVDDLSLRVADGEVVTLLGPTGCGKTTVLRLTAGLDAPTSGQVLIGGEDVGSVPPHERDLGMVFERGALLPFLDSGDNMAFGLRTRGVPEPEVARRVGAEARVLRLARFLRRRPGTLSAGQARRTEIGRATVRVPRAFLLDEPLTQLDAPERTRLRAELGKLIRGLGVTTLWVTHDQTEAMAAGDRLGVMRAGRMEQLAPPAEVYARPANSWVVTFMGRAGLLFGRVEEDPAGPVLVVGTERVGLTGLSQPTLAALTGRRVVAAARAEDVGPAGASAGPGRIAGVVARVEQHGSETIVACTVGAPAVRVPGEPFPQPEERATLLARYPVTTRPPGLGERVELAMDTTALHWFDPDSGAVLHHGG